MDATWFLKQRTKFICFYSAAPVAVTAASQLGVIFPPDIAMLLLRHSNPSVRAPARACVRPGRDAIS